MWCRSSRSWNCANGVDALDRVEMHVADNLAVVVLDGASMAVESKFEPFLGQASDADQVVVAFRDVKGVVEHDVASVKDL